MNSSHVEVFDRISEEFVERLRRGERPSLTDYVRDYPAVAGEIERLFPTLAVMEQAGSEVSALSGVMSTRTGPAPAETEEQAAMPERIGGYRIVREVGSGGMGVVYEAVQEALGRHVALKILPFRGGLNKKYLQRFQREAKAAARLQHPHIVPVFDVGEENGIHYYAMQFIDGEGLDPLPLTMSGGLRKSGRGSPKRSNTLMVKAWFIATSSPATCCSIAAA
jgi:Protein kinase domain